MPVEYRITTAAGDTIIKLLQNASVNQFAIPVTSQVTAVEVDPNNWIVNAENVQHDTTFRYTGIDNVAGITLSIYPNPVHNELVINTTGLQGSVQAQVFSADGKLLLTTSINNSTTTIDVKQLAAGAYLLKADGKVLRFVKE